MTEEEESYWTVFELLTDMIVSVAERGETPRNHLISPMADVLAASAVKSGSAETLRDKIGLMMERLEQAAKGEFPPAA